MSEARGRVTVHFVGSADGFGQAIVVLDKHTRQ
jgi:hypothetical protein